MEDGIRCRVRVVMAWTVWSAVTAPPPGWPSTPALWPRLVLAVAVAAVMCTVAFYPLFDLNSSHRSRL